MSKFPARAKPAPRPGKGQWLPALACGLVILFARPTAMLLLIFLLPSAMALVSDRSPGRPVARAVLLFGLAAACHPLDILWRSGHRMEDAMALATDLPTIATAWAAQAGGWLLTQLLPIVMTAALEAQARAEAARLAKRRADLLEEWGDDLR